MENSEKAIMIAFAVFVLVIALSLAMFMFVKVTTTSERLAFYSDSTIYYDNVMLTKKCDVCETENPIDVEVCRECKSVFPNINDSANDDIKNGDLVIEIGPGLGFLTNYLSKNANNVLCYEIDSEMVEVIKSRKWLWKRTLRKRETVRFLILVIQSVMPLKNI